MWHLYDAWNQARRLGTLPSPARDLLASLVALAAFAAGTALPLITVPFSALVVPMALLLTAVLLGRDSALLAALLTALAAQLSLFGPAGDGAGNPSGLLPIAALSVVALAVAALLEEMHRRRTDAEWAHLWVDATARRMTEDSEAGRRQLHKAEVRLTEAERKAGAAGQEARTAPMWIADPTLENAYRSEGRV